MDQKVTCHARANKPLQRQYRAAGAAAFLAESLGHLDDARAFATQALSAAARIESPFRYHRTLGLVDASDEDVQRRLWHLAKSV